MSAPRPQLRAHGLKVEKAEQFIYMAQVGADSAYDAAVSLAVIAAINAADADLTRAREFSSGRRSQVSGHAAASSRAQAGCSTPR